MLRPRAFVLAEGQGRRLRQDTNESQRAKYGAVHSIPSSIFNHLLWIVLVTALRLRGQLDSFLSILSCEEIPPLASDASTPEFAKESSLLPARRKILPASKCASA